jgi:hypothetical protein
VARICVFFFVAVHSGLPESILVALKASADTTVQGRGGSMVELKASFSGPSLLLGEVVAALVFYSV